jgi:hypothetical protein
LNDTRGLHGGSDRGALPENATSNGKQKRKNE